MDRHVSTIRDEGKIYTACGDGRVPFVSAIGVAAVAFRALTDEIPHNTDHGILGPELLTYDQVYRLFMHLYLTIPCQIAEKLTNVLRREIVHVKLSRAEDRDAR